MMGKTPARFKSASETTPNTFKATLTSEINISTSAQHSINATKAQKNNKKKQRKKKVAPQ